MAKKLATSRKASTTTTKSEQIVSLLKRAHGASIAELAKATDWQKHSVRGFISGTLKKKLNLDVTSTRAGDKERRYQIKVLS